MKIFRVRAMTQIREKSGEKFILFAEPGVIRFWIIWWEGFKNSIYKNDLFLEQLKTCPQSRQKLVFSVILDSRVPATLTVASAVAN